MYLSLHETTLKSFFLTLTLATGYKEEEKKEGTISQEVNLLAEATGKFDPNFFWKYLSSKVIKKVLVICDSQVPAKHIIMKPNVN